MGLYDQYKTSESLEEDGVWVDFGDGVSFKLRRLNSKVSRKVRKELEAPYQSQLRRNQDLPDDVAEGILRRQIASGVVVDWKGVTDEADKPMKYSAENALKLFTDLPDLLNDVAMAAAARATFREESVEEAKGN